MSKQVVAFGFLGHRLDAGRSPTRWERWRPTVALCSFEDFLVHRLELFIDAESQALAAQVIDDVRAVSPHTEVVLHEISIADPWDFEEVFALLHQFSRDYTFSVDEEEYYFHITTGTHVVQICSFLLAESRHFPARLLQTSPTGSHDFVAPAPTGSLRIIDLDLSRYDKLAARFAQERQEGTSLLKSGIATRNPEFNTLMERIEKVCLATDAPILLQGPTGVGKTRLARQIYALRERRRLLTGPFVEVNCATLRGDGAMSALFGHRRGAYTGAQEAREGLLRRADQGVLFLDEIGELGLDEQAMLLQAIETGRFLPLGADQEVESNFQLLAGTHRDLQTAVSEGLFREDLLARIDLWTFQLPGLANRPEDIEPNMDYELEDFRTRHGSTVRFNREARQRFLDFATSKEALWPDNFRGLYGAITRMATLADGGRIDRELVEEEIRRLQQRWTRCASQNPRALQASQRRELLITLLPLEDLESLDLFDEIQLAGVIEICRQSRNLSEAGRELFAQSRKTRSSTNDADRLRKYLARYGLQFVDL